MKTFVKTLEFIGNLICGAYLSICAVAFIVILTPVFVELIEENQAVFKMVTSILK